MKKTCWLPGRAFRKMFNYGFQTSFRLVAKRARLTHVRGHQAAEIQSGAVEGQYERTMHLFSLSEAIWKKSQRCYQPEEAHDDAEPPSAVSDHALAKKAASASAASQIGAAKQHSGLVLQPEVEQRLLTARMLEEWLASQDVRNGTTHEQYNFLELVVDTIMVEHGLKTPAKSIRPRGQKGEPLVWLLHGKPGTGKSYALSKLRSLFELCGYKQGLQYEFTAFQNTNAADLGGKTINSACGINGYRNNLVSAETAKRMSTWRWLLIDEVGLVGAKLLADVEQRLRSAVPDASDWKIGPDGRARPFAGINVIFTGDFGQLPPVEGGYLADIPRYFKDPTFEKVPHTMVECGQSLFWDGSVQGVTELVQVMRCKDDWWNEAGPHQTPKPPKIAKIVAVASKSFRKRT